MPTKTKVKRDLSWINVFFFFVISMLLLLALAMIGLVVINAVRPDVGDRLRVAVASKMLQEDFQRLLDDHKAAIRDRDAIAVKDDEIANLNRMLSDSQEEAAMLGTQLSLAKLELTELKGLIERLELDLANRVGKGEGALSILSSMEKFIESLKAARKEVGAGKTTADRIEVVKREVSKLDAMVKAFNATGSIHEIAGTLIDIEPGGGDRYLAVVKVSDFGQLEKEYWFSEGEFFRENGDTRSSDFSSLKVGIGSDEKQKLQVGKKVAIVGRLLSKLELQSDDFHSKAIRLPTLHCALLQYREVRLMFRLDDAKITIRE